MIKISTSKIMVFLCLSFATTTLLQGFSTFDAINRMWTAGIIGVTVTSILVNRITATNIVTLALTVISTAFSVYYAKGNPRINDVLYLGLWVLFLSYLRNYYDEFIAALHENLNLVHVFTLVWTLLVMLSFLYGPSFQADWGGSYFRSFASGPHRLASTCLIIMPAAVLLARVKNTPLYLLYLLLPLVVILLSGARTYLGVAFVYIVCVYYTYCSNRRVFYLTLIPFTLLAIVLVLKAPIGDKILSTMDVSEGDTDAFLSSVTNMRTDFWVYILDYFFSLSPWKQIVGDGATAVYEVTDAFFNSRIWAHNDIINLLISNGYLGCALYLSTYLSYSKYVFKKTDMHLVLKIGIVCIWLFNAMFNMVYTYTCAVLAIPLINHTLSLPYKAKNTNDEPLLPWMIIKYNYDY